MRAGSLADRRTICRLGILIGGLTLLLGSTAAPAPAQGLGLPRTYQLQRVDSPSPILAGGFGLVTLPIGDVNNDGEVDFATNQTEGTPNNEGQVWIYSGETGGQIGTFAAPDAGNPTNAAGNNRALVDRWMDRLGDIGSCPANTPAGQTCSSATIGAPDGANEFLLGAEGVDVDGVRDAGRVYVIDGRTFSVLKRIDMPPSDRALLAARQAQFGPGLNVRGGLGRTAATPRGLPVCQGNSGVTACPSDTAIPPAVRIGDMDGGGQPDIVVGANRFTETGATANPASHCAVSSAQSNAVVCFDAGRSYIYRGEEIAGSNPAVPLDGAGAGQTAPKILKNLAAQSDANDTTFTRSEIFGHAQMPIGDVGQCRTGGTFPAVGPGDRCTTAARTNLQDGKPEIVISAHRADTPIFDPDPAFFETGVSFLLDGATGAVLFIYNHPEPQPNALFGYTTRQSFPVGDLAGTTTTLPDLVQGAFQNAQNKAGAGRLYLLNGDPNAVFPLFGTLNDPTPTTNERFGIAREGVGDLVPDKPGTELLVGVFPSNTNLPDALTDLHFMNALSGEALQTISDPDQQLSSNFGYQIAPLGDLNEDGFLDFATSAPNWDSPAVGGAAGVRDQGRIYIFRSDNSPAPTTARPPAEPPAKPTPAPRSLAGCPAGKKQLVLTSANETRSGTTGADLIFAEDGNDVIDALAGDDCVDLGAGNDRGQGGAGKDLIRGRAGRDTLSGGSGADRLFGDAGNDRIAGGGSNDVINGGSGNDVINGGAGRDRISCGRGRDTVTADRRDRVARDCERVRGRR